MKITNSLVEWIVWGKDRFPLCLLTNWQMIGLPLFTQFPIEEPNSIFQPPKTTSQSSFSPHCHFLWGSKIQIFETDQGISHTFFSSNIINSSSHTHTYIYTYIYRDRLIDNISHLFPQNSTSYAPGRLGGCVSSQAHSAGGAPRSLDWRHVSWRRTTVNLGHLPSGKRLQKAMENHHF